MNEAATRLPVAVSTTAAMQTPIETRPASIDVEPALPAALLDLSALMRVPLSDLILAALCKDPEGARRMFIQIALQDGSERSTDWRQAAGRRSRGHRHRSMRIRTRCLSGDGLFADGGER